MPIEPFNTAIHDRARFKAAERFVAQTFVLVPREPRATPCEVFGYYTLVPHTYRDAKMDETTARALKMKSLGSIPMIMLGQLGVGIAHQGKGVGTALLRDALRRALAVALHTGSVAVITDPVDERADAFYRKHGFHPLPLRGPRLLIPTKQLAKYNVDIVAAFKRQPQMLDVRLSIKPFRRELKQGPWRPLS